MPNLVSNMYLPSTRVKRAINRRPGPWDRSNSRFIMTALSNVSHSTISQSVQVVRGVIGVLLARTVGRGNSSQGLSW